MYYSQCQEDIFLNENIFKNKKYGIYIELGALDGILYSNTKQPLSIKSCLFNPMFLCKNLIMFILPII